MRTPPNKELVPVRMSPSLHLAMGLGVAFVALILIVGPAAYADSLLSLAAQATPAPTVAAPAAPTMAPAPAALPTTGATQDDTNLPLAALGAILLIAGILIAIARPSRRAA